MKAIWNMFYPTAASLGGEKKDCEMKKSAATGDISKNER